MINLPLDGSNDNEKIAKDKQLNTSCKGDFQNFKKLRLMSLFDYRLFVRALKPRLK